MAPDVKKTLITGGQSMMAGYLKKVYGKQAVCLTRAELDISLHESLYSLLETGRFDTLINCAGAASADRETLFNINALYPANIAEVCGKLGVRFVMLSSARIFDGCKESPYVESDFPSPVDDYGLSKYAGEKFVENILYDGTFYVFRAPMVLGFRQRHPEAQLVTRLLEYCRSDNRIQVAEDVITSVVYAGDAAVKIKECLNRRLPSGIYHITSGQSVNLYNIMCRVVAELDLPVDVVPSHSGKFTNGKRISRFISLGTEILSLCHDWEETVRCFAIDYVNRSVCHVAK
ncbi:MAG: sugar nucleotide-binding protein [Pseudomonadota bacterium]